MPKPTFLAEPRPDRDGYRFETHWWSIAENGDVEWEGSGFFEEKADAVQVHDEKIEAGFLAIAQPRTNWRPPKDDSDIEEDDDADQEPDEGQTDVRLRPTVSSASRPQ